jgi:hypothetical protein
VAQAEFSFSAQTDLSMHSQKSRIPVLFICVVISRLIDEISELIPPGDPLARMSSAVLSTRHWRLDPETKVKIFAIKNVDLGTIGNTIAGALDGAGGGTLLTALLLSPPLLA